MKKLIITALMASFAIASYAQDAQSAAAAAAQAMSNAPAAAAPKAKPSYWTESAEFTLGFNQTTLNNWAAGGYNTVTMAAGIDGKADYAKGLMSWNNRLQLNYGFLWSADKANLMQKSNDRIYLESKWGYDFAKDSHWKYTASFDFRTQFSDTYDKYVLRAGTTDEWDGTLKSGLLAPAYVNLALGAQWKPTSWFDVNFAPLTGSVIVCTNEALRKTYGMQLRDESILAPVGADYRSALFQLGAQLKANAKATINDKFTYETQLVLFTDYLNKPFVYNRVNWDNKVSWSIGRFFALGLSTWLIYDPIVEIDGLTSLAQFKEFFSINFTYKIASKKK